MRRLKIVSPCHEDFGAMSGPRQRRFCDRCSKHVHNLEDMSRPEVEAFLAEHHGKSACVRYRVDRRGNPVFARPSSVPRPNPSPRLRPTSASIRFVGALSLATAACAAHVDPEDLQTPDDPLLCYDERGFAIACDEVAMVIPDAPPTPDEPKPRDTPLVELPPEVPPELPPDEEILGDEPTTDEGCNTEDPEYLMGDIEYIQGGIGPDEHLYMMGKQSPRERRSERREERRERRRQRREARLD